MKKLSVLVFLAFTLLPLSNANATGSIINILNILIENKLLNDAYSKDAELGEKICKMFKGSGCYSVSNLGEGICKAGGGSGCYSVSTIGEGICKAGGGSGCYSVSTIGEGLKKFKRSYVDREWAWDQFYHSTGSLVWACRGIQTGQFAKKTRCNGKPQNDYRWPNN